MLGGPAVGWVQGGDEPLDFVNQCRRPGIPPGVSRSNDRVVVTAGIQRYAPIATTPGLAIATSGTDEANLCDALNAPPFAVHPRGQDASNGPCYRKFGCSRGSCGSAGSGDLCYRGHGWVRAKF